MLKFIHITDIHLRAKTPRSRNDSDFLSTIIGKLEYVFSYAQKIHADAILCSGDVGDIPIWSPRVQIEFIQLLKKYKHIPFVTTIGNHDVTGSATETIDNSTLGVLQEAGVLHIVNNGYRKNWSNYTIGSSDGQTHARIYGCGFNAPITNTLLDGVDITNNSDGFTIALIHATVGPEDAMGRWKCIDNQNIHGNIDLALFGDVHCGFEATELKSGTIAYSPGSLVRLTKSESDNLVLFGLIEINDDYEFTIVDVEIPSSDDCFNEDNDDSYDDLAGQYKEIRMSSLEDKRESLKDKVFRVCADLQYSDDIANLVLSRCIDGDE